MDSAIVFGSVLLFSAYLSSHRTDHERRQTVAPDRWAAALRLDSTLPDRAGPQAITSSTCRSASA